MVHRPNAFNEFNGQSTVVENLKVTVKASALRKKVIGHILFTGPAGLGKSTLSLHVLPNEAGVTASFINCAAIEKPTDLTAVLSSVKEKDILFLDEVHALIPAAREHLLTYMEDQRISVKIGEGDSTKVLDVALPHFTIVAATTRQGLLDGPLRSRFQHMFTLQPYTEEEMTKVIKWHIDSQGSICVDGDDALTLLARASKGVARVGVNLVEAATDTAYAEVTADHPVLTVDVVERTLDRLGYRGIFTAEEWRYINVLVQVDSSMGLNALAAALDEQESTIENVYEPWLLRAGYVKRGRAGRELTEAGFNKFSEVRGEQP